MSQNKLMHVTFNDEYFQKQYQKTFGIFSNEQDLTNAVQELAYKYGFNHSDATQSLITDKQDYKIMDDMWLRMETLTVNDFDLNY